MDYQDIATVPWYRKSVTNSWFILIGLFIPPFIWAVASLLATGDIFYDKTDESGNLKKWSNANKVVAWVIIALQLYIWVFRRLR